jgi:hypothetical protein
MKSSDRLFCINEISLVLLVTLKVKEGELERSSDGCQ